MAIQFEPNKNFGREVTAPLQQKFLLAQKKFPLPPNSSKAVRDRFVKLWMKEMAK